MFTRLLEQGFRLGVRDYLDAVRALRAGYGGTRRDELRWLCEALWARGDAEARTLRLVFEQIPPPAPGEVERFQAAAGERAEPRRTDHRSQPDALKDGDAEAGGAPVPEAGLSFSRTGESGMAVPRARAAPSQGELFILTPRPVVPLRAMIVAWRRFRIALRTGARVELNVAATIDLQCRTGVLDEPVLVQARRNQARLVVLVDASRSMLPWRGFHELLAASLREGQLGEWAVFYFSNVPNEVLYRDPDLLRPEPLARVLRDHAGSTLLIVSDAGAARGGRGTPRARETAGFLARIRSHWHPVAWVNPMPRVRWKGTVAESIAARAGGAMFELTEDGLIRAVDLLRGQGGR